MAWKPKASAARPFSLLACSHSAPVSVAVKTGDAKKARVSPISIIPNVPGILASIQTLGGELVSSIQLQ